jgi:hypothetical protein
MRLKFILLGAILCLLVSGQSANAQGAGTSGNISGTVVDPTGAVLANTPLLAVEDQRGIQHSAETDVRGHYRFGGLAPAMYIVSVKVAGFAPEERRITVVLGETTTVDF